MRISFFPRFYWELLLFSEGKPPVFIVGGGEYYQHNISPFVLKCYLHNTPVSESNRICRLAKNMSPILNMWALQPSFLNSWWRCLHSVLRILISSWWFLTTSYVVSAIFNAICSSAPNLLNGYSKTRPIGRLKTLNFLTNDQIGVFSSTVYLLYHNFPHK